MDFLKITIHQIIKRQGIRHADLQLSNLLISIDENVENLVTKLNTSFGKEERVIRTEFIEDRVQDFQRTVKGFNDLKNDHNFLEFSTQSIGRMRDLISGVNLATGGYFVFTEYKSQGRHYAAVFLVRETDEIIFNRNESGDAFIIDKTTVINTSNLAMAVRVDLEKLQNNSERYVHFTYKQADISEYFVDWIEVRLSNKSEADTKTLINLINNVELPTDPDTDNPYEAEKFRGKVFDYIQSVGRVVKLSDLSRSFWGDSEFLSDQASVLGYDIDGEFRATPNILSRLKKYRITAGKISLSFSQSDIDTGKIYLGDDDLLVIDDAVLKRKFRQKDE